MCKEAPTVAILRHFSPPSLAPVVASRRCHTGRHTPNNLVRPSAMCARLSSVCMVCLIQSLGPVTWSLLRCTAFLPLRTLFCIRSSRRRRRLVLRDGLPTLLQLPPRSLPADLERDCWGRRVHAHWYARPRSRDLPTHSFQRSARVVSSAVGFVLPGTALYLHTGELVCARRT